MNEPDRHDYSFLDWSGDSGFKFDLGSSSHLGLCLVSSDDYGELRSGLVSLRDQLSLSRQFEFHFTHNTNAIRTVFFTRLLDLPWQASAFSVDKRDLPSDLRTMSNPTFYGSFTAHLMATSPLEIINVKRLLIDEQEKHSPLVKGIRREISPVLKARGINRRPKVRGEPAHRWDGLQVADMLIGALVLKKQGGTNYLRGAGWDRLKIIPYP